MTDNEIIKALECCIVRGNCQGCPLWNEHTSKCLEIAITNALDLINRQKAEIERLQTNCMSMAQTMPNMAKAERAEAIKEFAERLKATPLRFGVEYTEYYDKPSIYKLVPFVDDNDIDNLVKEVVGDD